MDMVGLIITILIFIIQDFIIHIPQSGGALEELRDLLRIFEAILNGDSNIKIRKGASASEAHLPRNEYDQ
jgi:hypothetical protein